MALRELTFLLEHVGMSQWSGAGGVGLPLGVGMHAKVTSIAWKACSLDLGRSVKKHEVLDGFGPHIYIYIYIYNL